MAVVAPGVLRTPDSAFENLPGWDYEPQYYTSHAVQELPVRMAYYDLAPLSAAAASGETLLLTHGEPSWSYLNRKLIPPLRAAGHRVVLFDQVGFGRSDKPASDADYTYARHIAWGEDLLVNHLDLRDVTPVLQDWGGLLGLRVVAAHAERFVRLVIANTFLPVCDDSFFQLPGGHFYGWKSACRRSQLADDSRMNVKVLMGRNGTAGPDGPISDAEAEAYNAPFPSDEYKAGARAFPELVPTPPTDPTEKIEDGNGAPGRPQPLQGPENLAAWTEVFDHFERPVITAFGSEDHVMLGAEKLWQERCPGCAGQAHTYIEQAGHFLQDGGWRQLSKVVLQFIEANPLKQLQAGLAGAKL